MKKTNAMPHDPLRSVDTSLMSVTQKKAYLRTLKRSVRAKVRR